MDLSVKIGECVLLNPVGVASGTFGYGSEYESLIDLETIGAVFTKAVTKEPRPGNDIPRIVETPSGMINSIGLANVGVDRFITDKMPFLSGLSSAVIVNVAGSLQEEYLYVVDKLSGCEGVAGYEINVSCPNVKHGGMALGTDPVLVEEITRSIREMTSKAVIIKLSPNVTDIAVIAKAAEAGGADAVSCINTLVGMVIDTATKKTAIPMRTGGLSGPAIRPVGVAMTYRVARAVSIPVIGIGGIMNADDALQYLLAGASAVQIGTGTFVDPAIPSKVLEGIQEYCEREGATCIGDLHSLLQ